MQARSDDVTRSCAAPRLLVPSGSETDHLDMDEAVAQLLA